VSRAKARPRPLLQPAASTPTKGGALSFSPPGRSALKFLQAGRFATRRFAALHARVSSTLVCKSVPASAAPARGLARTILYSLAAAAMLPDASLRSLRQGLVAQASPEPRRQLHPLRQRPRGSIRPAPSSGYRLRLSPASYSGDLLRL
jgi:hypothetical protein